MDFEKGLLGGDASAEVDEREVDRVDLMTFTREVLAREVLFRFDVGSDPLDPLLDLDALVDVSRTERTIHAVGHVKRTEALAFARDVRERRC